MRLHLTRSLALLAIGVGVLTLLGVPSGSADDVNHNGEIRNRITQWKARPDADRLFKGVTLDSSFTTTPAATAPAQAAQPPVTPPPVDAKAVALCIGINVFDNSADHYAGGAPTLGGCVNDAVEMAKILNAGGFHVTSLHDRQATAAAVKQFIQGQQKMAAGSTLVITFSGHGSQVADKNGDEADQRDETLCCHDRMIIDDELFDLWKGFNSGVRIVLVADSCHSGSVQRMTQQAQSVLTNPPRAIANRSTPAQRGAMQQQLRNLEATRGTRGANDRNDPQMGAVAGVQKRSIPFEVVQQLGLYDKPIYQEVRALNLPGEEGRGSEIKASLLTFAACTDDETAGEVSGHGVFTATLLDVFATSSTYNALDAAIRQKLSGHGQNPKFSKDGTGADTFAGQAPFKP